jgi:hypothetical protein
VTTPITTWRSVQTTTTSPRIGEGHLLSTLRSSAVSSPKRNNVPRESHVSTVTQGSKNSTIQINIRPNSVRAISQPPVFVITESTALSLTMKLKWAFIWLESLLSIQTFTYSTTRQCGVPLSTRPTIGRLASTLTIGKTSEESRKSICTLQKSANSGTKQKQLASIKTPAARDSNVCLAMGGMRVSTIPIILKHKFALSQSEKTVILSTVPRYIPPMNSDQTFLLVASERFPGVVLSPSLQLTMARGEVLVRDQVRKKLRLFGRIDFLTQKLTKRTWQQARRVPVTVRCSLWDLNHLYLPQVHRH